MRKTRYSKTALLVALMAVAAQYKAHSAVTTHYQRGGELFEMSRWVDARTELQKARGEEDGLTLRNIDYMLALCSAEMGLATSEAELDRFEEEYPGNPYSNDLSFMRGVIKTEEGDLDEAYERLKEVNPERLSDEEREQYNIRMGYLALRNGEEDRALRHFGEISEESIFYEHALYYISYIAYNHKDYDTAKIGFERLMASEQYSPVVPYYLLQIEFADGNYSGAIEYGRSLLKNASEQQQGVVIRTIAESYFRNNDYQQAIEYIDRFAASGEELGRTESYIKGFSLHQLKRYKEAVTPLKNACGADDELTQNASFHLANCYLHTEDKRGALKAFSMASNDKFNAQIAEEALFNQAKLQYELGGGLFNETINLLTRYLNTYDDPKRRAVAQTLLAAAYYNSRDYATAYDKIGQIKNPDAEIRAAQQKITYLYGLECFCEGDYKEARRYLSESIKIGVTPKQTSLAAFWIGEIDFRDGNYDDALKGYNYLLARAPKGDKATLEANYSVAYALYMQGKMNTALEYFQKYVGSTDSDPALRADAYNRIGDIYYGARNFSMATKSYRNAALSGEEAGGNYAKYQMAIILGVEGDNNGKIKALRGIVNGATSKDAEYVDDALYELGNTYIKSGDYKSAITTLEQFLTDYPNSPKYAQTLSDLGVAYINNNDSKSALEYYDKAIKAAPQSQVAKDAMQGVREIYISQGKANRYFEYAESIGMEGDLNAVMRDSLSFASARGLYFSSDESANKQRKAASALDGYIKGYSNGYYLSDALFYLSDCYIKLNEIDSAISTLTSLDERGNNQYSERVYKILTKLNYDQGYLLPSAEISRKLFDVAKDDATREEAMSHYAKATIESGDEAAIQRMSADVLSVGEKGAGAEATTEALFVKATNLRESGAREEALKIYQNLTKRESAAKYFGESSYYIIDNAMRAGDMERAESLIFDFSESKSPDAYWLAKSFILLGDIYVAREDNFQARATYQSIVDGYSNTEDGVIDEAKMKIGELK